jgi:type IV pilus assembly protein PilW
MSARTALIARGTARSRRRMRGLSLIELMIAVTISLVVLAAVGWVYQGTAKTYRTHDALSRMQEGARYAFEVMSKDLRMAGVTACPYQTKINALKNPTTDWYKDLFDRPIGSAAQDGASGAMTEFSDTLSVLRADVAREYIVASHNSGGGQFTLDTTPDFGNGQLMVATDCNNVSVFQASTVSSATKTVTYTATGLNATTALGTTYQKANGSRLYRLSAVTYYVAKNAAGEPSLFRRTPTGAGGALVDEELIEGVEDLRVTFGVDTTATPDGIADYDNSENPDVPYLSGGFIDDVTKDAALGATVEKRWARVVSVRVSLLMRTAEDRVVPTAQKYKYNGASHTATDLRLRKVFTHVIKLRNR